MKKILLSFLFVIAFLCGSALVVSAKTTSSPANSVAVSKKVLVAKTKAKSLKASCEVNSGCAGELLVLLFWNSVYEYYCAPDYLASCESGTANAVINAGYAYEQCLANPILSKNTDRTMDRNKTVKLRDVTSR
jgi:hypothetical protein